jgi:hypothetical protein
MDEFTLFTSHVATRLGVSKERVTELRKNLPEGEEWKRDGNRVLFKETVVEKMAGLLKVPELPEEPFRPKECAVVVAKLWPNPFYVGGVPVECAARTFAVVPPGEMVRVKVKHSQNLIRGMVLPCRELEKGLFEALELPRRKGRW